jgi:hypothetical protein
MFGTIRVFAQSFFVSVSIYFPGAYIIIATPVNAVKMSAQIRMGNFISKTRDLSTALLYRANNQE